MASPAPTASPGMSSSAASVAVGNNKSSATPASRQQHEQPLHLRFPVNTVWQFELDNSTGPKQEAPYEEKVEGKIYCTDPDTNLIVLEHTLSHTTLASAVTVIPAHRIGHAIQKADDKATAALLTQPLPKLQRKVLEDRERRALKLAEEALRHVNQKVSASVDSASASPEGQRVFDRLLKACGEVSWGPHNKIVVLHQIQVDPPYQADSCRILTGQQQPNKSVLESLERVKKIVTAAATAASSTTSAPVSGNSTRSGG